MAFGKFAQVVRSMQKGRSKGSGGKLARAASSGLRKKTRGGGGGKGAGPRQRIAKMRASGNKSGAYKAIRRLRKKC